MKKTLISIIILALASCDKSTPEAANLEAKTEQADIATPEKVNSADQLREWYEVNRGGIGGSYETEVRGGTALVVWAKRKGNEEYTLVSTYLKPDNQNEFHHGFDERIQSLDYGDGVMRHFGEVIYIEDNDTLAYYLVPGVIYSHGLDVNASLQHLTKNLTEQGEASDR